ncbi:MAG: AAA family ATPase, partial [Beijerinckiaceae bacterium]|nr:AAA family ATPase [Beijerinckiaceae bacterium]
ETIAFLMRLCAKAGDATPPMSTHISRIFFAGEKVFKLKRAVRTSYLDFSSPKQRLQACRNELALNMRTAPQLYRAVRTITRQPDGLAFDGSGESIDAVVEMNRFDQFDLADQMTQRGALDARHVEKLAHTIAMFHGAATAAAANGGARKVSDVLAMNAAATRESFLARERDLAPLCEAMRGALARNAALLDRRRAAGKVRRCHGDLTLRNIVVIDGEPTPFDCLEFDEALATIDVLYDLAFVLMDLWHRSRGDLANVLLNRYLDAADETDGLPLLPLFIAMRAIIRAHVTARMSEDAEGQAREALMREARDYVLLAEAAMREGAPVLVGVGGLSGSGKSTVAAALAPHLAPIPGARVLSSDRIRKALFGAAPTDRLPQEAYAPQVSERVYARARAGAGKCLDAGWPVICDAVFDRRADRDALAHVAQECVAPFLGVWLEAPAQTLAARVAARTGDPSDATVDVLQAQQAKLAASGEAMDWTRLDATAPPEATAARIRDALET